MYNILICDDQPDIVNALKIYLTTEGYRLFTASNGIEALENGITAGISATQFGATGTCNRAQVVTFLYRAFGK